MTLPRPVLIAILGLALCAAAFLATRSANDTGNAVTSVTPQPTPVVKHPIKPVKPVHPATKPHRAVPVKPHPAAKPQAAAKPQPATKPQTTHPATPAKPPVSPDVARTLPAVKALGSADVFGSTYQVILLAIVQWNCVLAIFNLVPIPPLDGANVVYGLLPPRQQYSWRTYQQYGPFLLLFVLLLAPQILSLLVFGPAIAIERILLGV